jgi:hypothetical protein
MRTATETMRWLRRTFTLGSGFAGPRAGSRRIEPDIGPVALDRTIEEGFDPIIDLLAQPVGLTLGDA